MKKICILSAIALLVVIMISVANPTFASTTLTIAIILTVVMVCSGIVAIMKSIYNPYNL